MNKIFKIYIKKVKEIILKNIYIFLLIVISFVGHWYLFFDLKTLNAGDWVYHFNSQASTILNFGIYYDAFNYGQVSVFGNNWVFYLFYYILNLFGINWDIGTRILFLLPIIFLTPIFSFLFFRKFFKNDIIAFFSATLFSFNTFFLKLQLDWLTYAFMWWILPALLLIYLKYIDSNKKKYLVFNIIVIFLGMVYEVRIMFLILIFVFIFQVANTLFSIKNKNILKRNIYFFLSFLIVPITHTFWLLPAKFGNLISDVLSNAAPSPFASYYDLLDVITLHMYSWSHNLVFEAFIKQPVDVQYFLIPLISIIGLISYKSYLKEKKDQNFFLLFNLLLVIFIFLGKQSFPPFTFVYDWLFYHLPLFNLYRESSKFFIFVAFCISMSFGIGLHNILIYLKFKYNRKIIYIITSLLLFFTSIFNLQHFIDQSIGGMTKGININNDYLVFEKYLNTDNAEFSRILYLPIVPRFGFYSDKHPFISGPGLLSSLYTWIGFQLFDKSALPNVQLLSILKHQYSDYLLDISNVKYVVLPPSDSRERKVSIDNIQTVPELFYDYGGREDPSIRQWYMAELDKIPFLKRIDIGSKDMIVYKNENYKVYINTFNSLTEFTSTKNFDLKYNFISNNKINDFNFVIKNSQKNLISKKIINIFEDVNYHQINEFKISSEILNKNLTSLYTFKDTGALNFNNQNLIIDSSTTTSSNTINKYIISNQNHAEYNNVNKLINMINNPSFEEGLWKNKVGDCNHYDNNQKINMNLNSNEKTDGKNSLQLEAITHAACTSTNVSLVQNSFYLLSFDYQSPNAVQAAFYLSFNDSSNTAISQQFDLKNANWNTYNKIIKTPLGSSSASLTLYSFAKDDKTNIITRYDNFHLIKLPDDILDYWLVSDPQTNFVNPTSTTFDIISPTKKLVHIQGASTPFYLSMSEAYHDQWQLEMNNSKINGPLSSWIPWAHPDMVPNDQHFKLDDFLNGWYVDVPKLCETEHYEGCTKNADGSYDLEMVIEFWPQRWFYVGLIISGTTLISILGYLGYDLTKRIKRRMKIKKIKVKVIDEDTTLSP